MRNKCINFRKLTQAVSRSEPQASGRKASQAYGWAGAGICPLTHASNHKDILLLFAGCFLQTENLSRFIRKTLLPTKREKRAKLS